MSHGAHKKNARICRWIEELSEKTRFAPDRESIREFERLYDPLHTTDYYEGLLADCAGQPSSRKGGYEMS